MLNITEDAAEPSLLELGLRSYTSKRFDSRSSEHVSQSLRIDRQVHVGLFSGEGGGVHAIQLSNVSLYHIGIPGYLTEQVMLVLLGRIFLFYLACCFLIHESYFVFGTF